MVVLVVCVLSVLRAKVGRCYALMVTLFALLSEHIWFGVVDAVVVWCCLMVVGANEIALSVVGEGGRMWMLL